MRTRFIIIDFLMTTWNQESSEIFRWKLQIHCTYGMKQIHVCLILLTPSIFQFAFSI